jgi:hypothetical protein
MKNHESNNESEIPSGAQLESMSGDRRAFIKAAVKTAVAGTVVAGIATSAGTAEAGTTSGFCGTPVVVPPAVVKARVLFNKQIPITRQQVMATLSSIFDASSCLSCGMVGVFGPFDPGTVTEIHLGLGYLDGSQVSAVSFTDA